MISDPLPTSLPSLPRAIGAGVVLLSLMLAGGCATTRWAELREVPWNPLVQELRLDSKKGPQATARTLQALRKRDLTHLVDRPVELLQRLQLQAAREPTADNVYAITEVAYVGAKQQELDGNTQEALDLYGTAVANAYFYLFDRSLDRGRNHYDPRFRVACDVYNAALESAMRQVKKQGSVRPGGRVTIETPRQIFDITIASRGTWCEDNFKELLFVSDFKVKELTNRSRTYGLGVPLIAVYQPHRGYSKADRFYPPGMSFPVTAFMRVVDTRLQPGATPKIRHECIIELHDTLSQSQILVGNELVPLETDLTTPLAYSLENPVFRQANTPLRNLKDVEESTAMAGLYLLEPFDPTKIPVVMVHGFWSSLVTWMEMFNDLRGSPEIRDRYQFWFYLYPTGPPFWYSARHLRQELVDARELLDPQHMAAPFDQMVLVGHSMGGLIATLQTLDSGEDLWQLASQRPLNSIVAQPAITQYLGSTFYFRANPSVKRVVTIATPHGGSNTSNSATRWLGRTFIDFPEYLLDTRRQLIKDNPDAFPDGSLIEISTAVDAMAIGAPVLEMIRAKPRPPSVVYHNIIGQTHTRNVLGRAVTDSDGVVKIHDARSRHAVSEVIVNAEHTDVHRHAAAILEVRRILLEHASTISTVAPPAAQNLEFTLMP